MQFIFFEIKVSAMNWLVHNTDKKESNLHKWWRVFYSEGSFEGSRTDVATILVSAGNVRLKP